MCLLVLFSCGQSETTNNSIDQNIELSADSHASIGDTITITSSPNNLNADELTYQWEQTEGNSVVLSVTDTDSLHFTATESDTLVFTLTASNEQGEEYTNSISITIDPTEYEEDEQHYSVQLYWEAPIENEDGSLLNNLAGYIIYYGQSEKQLDNTVLITDPTKVEYEINQLESEFNYYFCVSAYNTKGRESQCSEIVNIAL